MGAMEAMSLQYTNCEKEEEEEETVGDTAHEILSSVRQCKRDVLLKPWTRKKKAQEGENALESPYRHDPVRRSSSTQIKYTPNGDSLGKDSHYFNHMLLDKCNFTGESYLSHVMPQSTSKMTRSISTPEMRSKIILPALSSNTKYATHRKIDFSYDKQEKENNFLVRRGTMPKMPRMKEYFNTGRHSKFPLSDVMPKESEEASHSDSYLSFYHSKTRPSNIPASCSIVGHSKDNIKLIEDKQHSMNKLGENKCYCNCRETVSTPGDKYSNPNHNSMIINSLTQIHERKNKTEDAVPRICFPKVEAASHENTISKLTSQLTTTLFKTPSLSSLREMAMKHHNHQPFQSPLPLKKTDVITVNQLTYFTLCELGKGGSSMVYEVIDLSSRQRKAVKIVTLENEDEVMRKSYKNEIQILRRLQYSPRIIKLFDHEETPTHLKLVMEVGEIDLSRILSEARQKKNAPISAFSIQHYWQGMLLAVQVIHQEGIIHSDLKPANFLLVNGTLKLIDFGIASSVQKDMTSVFKDVQAGTYNYMSPESLNDVYSEPGFDGEAKDKPTIKISVKSDVWSLGCILYSLVYSKTPFQHLSPFQKLAAISNPATIISFPPVTDKNLIDVMQKCLQFDPYNRLSIKELLCHPYLDGTLTPKDSPKNAPFSKTLCSTSTVQYISPVEKK